MPINPNIILGVQPAQFKVADPFESAQKSLALQALMGQQDLHAIQLRQAQQAESDDAATREAFKGGGDRAAIVQRLMGAGQWRAAQAVEKAGLDTRKAMSDIERTEQETAASRAKMGRDLIASANPQNYPQIIAEGQKLGQQWAMTAPPQFDPNWQRQHVLTADKWLEVNAPKIEFKSDNKVMRAVDVNPFTNPNVGNFSMPMQTTPGEDLTDRRTREEGAANRGVQIRGQNMTDARSKESNAIQAGRNTREDMDALRKEFDQLAEVKNYKAAYPAFAAVKDAASRDTLQSDINLVYGLAKLYDPTSVVREGEYATVANNQAIPEKLKGIIQSVGGGAKMTPETRKQIMIEAEGRIKQYEDQYGKARTGFEGIAKTRGYQPNQVFTDTGRMSVGKPAQPAATQTAPTMPAIPKAGEVRGGYRFKGGDPSQKSSWEKV